MNDTRHMDQDFRCRMNAELARARAKFPGNKVMLAALTEEVGELAKALLDHAMGKTVSDDIVDEAVQVAVMAQRLATEGDSSFPYKPGHRSILQSAAPLENFPDDAPVG